MKAFFKAVINIKYTENKDKYDFNQLKEFLKEEGQIDDTFDFEGQIEEYDSLIQVLIKDAGYSQGDELEQLFIKQGYQDEREINDLVTVWENENDKVYSYLIKKNTFHKQLEKLEWSVNKQFYSKKAKNLSGVSCVVSLKTSEVQNINNKFQSNTKNITFEMNQEELNNLESELDKIENEISNLFLDEQEEEDEDEEQ